MSGLRPERYLTRLTAVDLQADVLEAGFSALLLDVDNTLLPRDGGDVPSDIAAWVEAAKAAGLRICLISNNWNTPVLDVARRFDLPLEYGCTKPLPFGFARARATIGADRATTLVIGDQLITDVWGAHLSGMRAILLQPLATADLWHTLALRRLERVILYGKHPEDL